MAKDRSHDIRRVPNSAAPIVWQKGIEDTDEPYRHVSVGDLEAARERQAQHEAESKEHQ